MGLANVNVRIGADIKGFSKAMDNATRSMRRLGKNMANTGRTMTRTLTLPLGIIGVLAVKTFADFEQSMAKVKAVSGATSKEFKDLQKNAQDLGASTRFTASQVAALQLNFSKLGFSASEIVKVTEATLNLALATGEDLARSAEVAGNTLRAMDIDVEETGRVVDVMAASFSSSALDLEKWAESMKFAAPIANSVGVEIEKLAGILSVMADAGISGSLAGTSLRRIFIELDKKGLSLEQALQKVAAGGFKLSEATDLVGARANAALLVLAKNQDKVVELTAAYKGAEGAAGGMAKIMDDTLQGALFKVRSALEATGIEIGKVLMPLVKRLGNFVIEITKSFRSLSDGQKKFRLIIVAVVAGLGPLLFIFGKIFIIIPKLITFFRALFILMATNPFTAIAIAIGLTVAAIVALTRGTKEAKKETSEFSKALNKEVGELNALFGILKTSNVETKARKTAIKQINEVYGSYLPNLLTEKSTIQDINKAQTIANKLLIQEIAIKSQQEELTKANTEAITAQREVLENIRSEVTALKGEAFAGVAVAGLGDLQKELSNTAISISQFGDSMITTFSTEGIKIIDDYAQRFGLSSIDVTNGITKILNATKRQETSVRNINDFYNAYIENLDLTKIKLDENTKNTVALADETKTLKAILQKTTSALALLIDGFQPRSFAEFKQGIKDIDKETKNLGFTFIKLPDAVKKGPGLLEKLIEDLPAKLESIKQKFGELANKINIIFGSISGIVFEAINKTFAVFDKLTSATNEILDTLQSVTDKKISDLEKVTAAEIEAINKSNASQEEKAKLIDELEKETAKKKLKLEEATAAKKEEIEARTAAKKRKLLRQQGIAEKLAAIASIIINTAVAVVKALPNLVLAGIVGVAGAIQGAIVASTPIPGLAKGGRAPAGSPFIVGELGPELFVPNQNGTVIPNNRMGGGGIGRLTTALRGRDLEIVLERSDRMTSRIV